MKIEDIADNMKDSKILTITIPAYNAESYLNRCLDSFMSISSDGSKAFDKRLDIIIIDDGSKDGTKEIALKYVDAFPEVFRLISKENGGHGSGINKGIENAQGKYFKVVDSDDWVVTENISIILDILENESPDVIITGYKSFNEQNGAEHFYNADLSEQRTEAGNAVCAEAISFEDFAEIFEKFPASFQFHGLCYRTEYYKEAGIKMSEGIFYEDQEYAALPFIKAKTISAIPLCFYVYRLGGSGQSVDHKNQEKHLNDMEQVIRVLVDAHLLASEGDHWDKDREKFFIKRISIAVSSFYAVALVKARDKRSGRKRANDMRKYLDEKEPHVAEITKRKYDLLIKAGKVPGLANIYSGLSDSSLYERFKKRWLDMQ